MARIVQQFPGVTGGVEGAGGDGFEAAPDTIASSADVFHGIAGKLRDLVSSSHVLLQVRPWLGEGDEPVSEWAADEFNRHFALLLRNIEQLAADHQAMGDRLASVRSAYESAEDESVARFRAT